MTSFDFVVADEHPSLAGHFPGNPIVPGAVIIEQIMQGFCALNEAKEIASLVTIKLMKPILPQQQVRVHFKEISAVLFSFECITNKEVSVIGRLKIK
ncbi:(3R)-hydroxymyristoyl-[ACP] dehydratase [uncultured Candidatus Thioglobus sp.]|nr:(3R)-hydroxymyristoyl-[ACP] dehydratase [uncultured Candidatus Thioglobus sp.]